MIETPMNAPGCFAAASVFSHDSDICRQCCVFDACASASLATLETIRGIVNVQDLMKRHAKARQVSQAEIKATDAAKAATRPPGNIPQPLMKPVERKTQVAQVKFDPTSDELLVIESLPVKPQKIALALLKSGVFAQIKKGVQEGHNALSNTGPGWLRVALTLLLAGGCSKTELRKAIMVELDWADTSAGPHASMAWVLFVAFGIAQENEGRLVLVPAIARDN